MSEIKISSTGWLAISLQNGAAGVFNLNDTRSWQYLKAESIVDQSEDLSQKKEQIEEDDFNRNLNKFSPNGQVLVISGQNKQFYVYTQLDFEKTEVWWKLQRIIISKKPSSALDVTNEFLLIADKSGDMYKVDLSINDNNEKLIQPVENRIMRHSSMLLDIVFIRINDKKSFILTAGQNEQIRLDYYPNTSNIEQHYCLGHTEFVSHIKLIDDKYILSTSGDGTLRLWRFPDCVPLVLLHSKAFTLSTKQVFYSQLYQSERCNLSENYQTNTIPHESLLDSSSINYSIWKMDVACRNSTDSDVFIAFSIYAYRSHSIYLTSLSNMRELANEERKLIFDISYGTIVDYCFPSKEILFDDYITDSKCYLFILFDSNTLLKVDIISVLLCDEAELFVQPDETIQEINNILATKEFHSMNSMNINKTSNDILYKQLFKNRTNSNDNSYCKRKTDKTDEQQRKRQASSQIEENISLVEYF